MRARSHIEQQELALPRADHLHEGLELGALDGRVGRHEGTAEHRPQFIVRLEQVDGLEQAARQVDFVLVGAW